LARYFALSFFIVKSMDSSLNFSWLKRPAQGLYFVLSIDVLNTMLVSISLVCNSKQQKHRKIIFFGTYLLGDILSDFVTLHSPELTHTSHFLHSNLFFYLFYLFYYYFFILFYFILFGMQSKYINRVWRIKLVNYCCILLQGM